MFRWLFGVFFDRVVGRVKVKATGERSEREKEDEELNESYLQMMKCWWQNPAHYR